MTPEASDEKPSFMQRIQAKRVFPNGHPIYLTEIIVVATALVLLKLVLAGVVVAAGLTIPGPMSDLDRASAMIDAGIVMVTCFVGSFASFYLRHTDVFAAETRAELERQDVAKRKLLEQELLIDELKRRLKAHEDL